MRNRAKCKLCQSIIESMHRYDYVTCKCGEIAVAGGLDSLECAAKDWSNFLRVDDDNNEIIVNVKEKEPVEEISPIQTKADLLNTLNVMISNIEKLPQHAMMQPITHYDFCSLMLLLSAIFRFDCKDDN